MTPAHHISTIEAMFVVLLCVGFGWLLVLIVRNIARALRFEYESPAPNAAKRSAPDNSDLNALLAKATATAQQDPLNPQPKAMQPILFSDGYRLELADIHKAGLSPLIDVNGRIVALMDLSKPQKGSITVEDWCGPSHGARIS
jgi:hypothetical protein